MRNKKHAPRPRRRTSDIISKSEIAVVVSIFTSYMILVWLIIQLAMNF